MLLARGIMKFHFRAFGIWFSTASGNCFAPALQLNHQGLTIRTNNWQETHIGCRSDGSWWWNSDHIARRFGKHYPGDEEKGYPDLWEYKGILGFLYSHSVKAPTDDGKQPLQVCSGCFFDGVANQPRLRTYQIDVDELFRSVGADVQILIKANDVYDELTNIHEKVTEALRILQTLPCRENSQP